MPLDIPTLFAVNVLCSLIFATATALSAYTDPGRIYWRHWCLCFSFGAAALLSSTIGAYAASTVMFLAGQLFLVPTFFFYFAGTCSLAGHTIPLRHLFAVFAIVAPLTAAGYLIGPISLAEVPALFYIIVTALACTYQFAQEPFADLSSRFGLILANLLQIGISLVHVLHSMNGHSPVGDLTEEMLTTIHLLVSITFTVLTGTFLFALVHERTALENRNEALRDPLTNAFNRRAFDQYLNLLLARREPGAFALMHFDLDHFKSVNDRFGHAAGDRVLVEFAEILQDIAPRPRLVARLGGEEFAVIANDITEWHAIDTADLIRQAMENKTFEFESGRCAAATTSVGLYHGTGDGLASHALLDIVDKCLYEAKRTGRNRVVKAAAGASDTAPSTEGRLPHLAQPGP